MFDKMKQLFDLQNTMKTVKRELEVSSVEAQARNGQVRIVISGDQKVKSLEIADSLFGAQNKTSLQADLVSCFNDAIRKSQVLAADKMKQATGINLPGL